MVVTCKKVIVKELFKSDKTGNLFVDLYDLENSGDFKLVFPAGNVPELQPGSTVSDLTATVKPRLYKGALSLNVLQFSAKKG